MWRAAVGAPWEVLSASRWQRGELPWGTDKTGRRADLASACRQTFVLIPTDAPGDNLSRKENTLSRTVQAHNRPIPRRVSRGIKEADISCDEKGAIKEAPTKTQPIKAPPAAPHPLITRPMEESSNRPSTEQPGATAGGRSSPGYPFVSTLTFSRELLWIPLHGPFFSPFPPFQRRASIDYPHKESIPVYYACLAQPLGLPGAVSVYFLHITYTRTHISLTSKLSSPASS